MLAWQYTWCKGNKKFSIITKAETGTYLDRDKIILADSVYHQTAHLAVKQFQSINTPSRAKL